MLTLDQGEFFENLKAGNTARVKQLIENNPSLLDAKHVTGATGILFALYTGHQELAELLAQRKHDLDIFEAASLGRMEQMRALVKRDRELVNAYSPEGFTALQLAAYLGQEEAVDFLLKAGANVNAIARNPSGYTALSGAVSRGHRNIAETILANGANVNHRYEGGFSLLMEAAASGNLEITKLLLAHGADPQARTADGKTALAYAVEKGHNEVAALLKEHNPKT